MLRERRRICIAHNNFIGTFLDARLYADRMECLSNDVRSQTLSRDTRFGGAHNFSILLHMGKASARARAIQEGFKHIYANSPIYSS